MPHSSKQATADFELDTILTILGNERRRVALRYACTHGQTTTKELATHVASIETGKDPSQLTSKERQRAYITLYQEHLPKMATAGFITYDDHEVEPMEWTHDLWEPLDQLDAIVDDSVEHDPPNGFGIGLRGFRLKLTRNRGDSA